MPIGPEDKIPEVRSPVPAGGITDLEIRAWMQLCSFADTHMCTRYTTVGCTRLSGLIMNCPAVTGFSVSGSIMVETSNREDLLRMENDGNKRGVD